MPRSYRAHSLLGVEAEHVTGHGFGNANAIHPGSVKTDLNLTGELTLEQGAKSSVELATLGSGGPNGTFSHLGNPLPW